MEKFFGTKNAKRLVIKALEFVMKKEKFTYYDIYTVRKVVKRTLRDSLRALLKPYVTSF